MTTTINNHFFDLPEELQRMIYSYDSTYRNIYNDCMYMLRYVLQPNQKRMYYDLPVFHMIQEEHYRLWKLEYDTPDDSDSDFEEDSDEEDEDA